LTRVDKIVTKNLKKDLIFMCNMMYNCVAFFFKKCIMVVSVIRGGGWKRGNLVQKKSKIYEKMRYNKTRGVKK